MQELWEIQLNGFGTRLNKQEVLNGEQGIEIINMKEDIRCNKEKIELIELGIHKLDKKQTVVYAIGTLIIILVNVFFK